MTDRFEEPAALDRLIHDPARLTLTTVLLSSEGADFTFLLNLTGLTKGNLSSHLHKLESAGVVEVTKSGAGRSARTWVALTEEGVRATKRHWEQLDRLRERAEEGF